MMIDKVLYDKMPDDIKKLVLVIRDEVMEEFDKAGKLKSDYNPKADPKQYKGGSFGGGFVPSNNISGYGDEGSAARFFYCSKASGKEKNEGTETISSGCTHPTVKPIKLMSYLINMITPPNGVVLDMFLGSGSTGVAAVKNNYNFIGIEMNPEYMEIAKARINYSNDVSKKM